MKKTIYAMTGLLLAASAAAAAPAQDGPNSVMLLDFNYAYGKWSVKPYKALPCEAPSKPDHWSPTSSRLVIHDYWGKAVYQRAIANPRIILVEDPREPVDLLKKVSFTVAVPLTEEMSILAFHEGANERKSPSARLDIGAAAAEYWASRASAKQADCQFPKPDRSKLPRLPEPKDNSLSIDEITRMVHEDQPSLIKQGLSLDLHPKEVKALIYGNRTDWRDVEVTQKDVATFLERYTAAYKAQR